MNGNTDKNNCIIIASGSLGDPEYLKPFLSGFYIFVDGGLNHAQKLCIQPDLIIGDMDSFGGSLDAYMCKVVKHDTEKDDTDTGLAIKYAVENGYTNITVIGGMGGRLDHTFANIQNMAWAVENGAEISMISNDCHLYVTNRSPFVFNKTKMKYVSVFSYSKKLTDVTLKGMKYPLDNALVTNNFPIGVSNECVEDLCSVSFSSGTALIMLCDEA